MTTRTQRYDVWTSPMLHIAATVYDPDQPLLITFAPAMPTKEPFGGPLLRRKRINHISVTSFTSDWYQYEEVDEAGAALGQAASRFCRVAHYGSSMGGFGALFFSGAVNPACVMAVSPQFSIVPGDEPFETRWAANNSRIEAYGGFLEKRMAGRLMLGGKIMIAFDPRNPDAQHVALFEAVRPIERLIVPFGGHGLLFCLAQMGIASSVATAGLHADPDVPALRRQIRGVRHLSSEYAGALAKKLHERGGRGVARAVAMALERLPENESGHAIALMNLATQAEDPALSARVFLEFIEAAIVDGDLGLIARLRQRAKDLIAYELVENAFTRLDVWIADAAIPRTSEVAKINNTLRRYIANDPLKSVRVRSALRLLRWSGPPDTFVLASVAKAILLHAVGRGDEAIDLLDETSGLVGGWHPMNLELARTWAFFGDDDKALAFARRVTAREPNNEHAFLLVAGKLEATGDMPAAIDAYHHARSLTPQEKPGWIAVSNSLARCLKLDDRGEDAIVVLDEILERKRENIVAWRLKVSILNELDDGVRTLAACEAAAVAVGKDPMIDRIADRLRARNEAA